MTKTGSEAPGPIGRVSEYGLESSGIHPKGTVYWNLSPAELYEASLSRAEGRLAHQGGFTAVTSPHTGRSPRDKYTVRDESTEESVDWGDVNAPLSPDCYRTLRAAIVEHLNGRDLFVRDARAGSDTAYGISVRVVTPSAWHSLFAHNMFLRIHGSDLQKQEPDFTVLHAPTFEADPAVHGTRSSTAIVVSFTDRTVLICGTQYAGEIKKSIFSVLNYLLPERGVLPMHCSANVGEDGAVALFFGLSGTGKTTLSADVGRGLIGDDEHGWSDRGVFNFEGGCYAKTIRLSRENEPEIHAATHRFGTVLENVVLVDETREIDFDDASITENARASYPIHFIPNAVIPGQGGHPTDVVFLTADAFGVLPPISRLTPEQAMYHFLSGYTAKVAGTERGVTEPIATFSACFGGPFLPRHPVVYAEMLGARLREGGANVWLVNTGWTGGAYGAGDRMKLRYTRAMVRAALAGRLDEIEAEPEPVFGLSVPVGVPDVPTECLRPRDAWPEGEAYDSKARELAGMFSDNFARYADQVDDRVVAAGPRV